jgi:hypothetical protein
MFAEYFEAAARHLRSIGRTPLIRVGDALTNEHLAQVERVIAQPIPVDLRSYLCEMGDKYSFSPDENQNGFGLGFLEDYRFQIPGFPESLQEEAVLERCRRNAPELVQRELARRKKWFPFYNFGCGRYLFCLDLSETPAPVRYYECVYWPNDSPEEWDFRLADSLLEFVRQWSRYCFSDSNGTTLINVAMHATGRFDWAPSRFNPLYDRATTEA